MAGHAYPVPNTVHTRLTRDSRVHIQFRSVLQPPLRLGTFLQLSGYTLT